jgi:endonuclease/exonuclease/phosphatase (EEP) superfamily protein YafD
MVITVAVVAYAVSMALVAAVIAITGDSNAFGMLLLFGPRWLLVFPWLLLVPLALMASRRVALIALAGAAVTLFGASGFEVPIPSALWRGAGDVKALRVVTYNTDGSKALASRIASDLRTWNADVVVLQDCSPEVGEVLRQREMVRSVPRPYEPRPYRTYRDVEFCILSRLPISNLTRKARELGSREDGRALRFSFLWNGTPISMATVHLPSPRDALGAARRGSPELLEGSIRVRYGASRATASWVGTGQTADALIVAGDFNLPAESRALRDDWGSLRNAFSEVGWGFGHTMFAGRHRVRIDHVLVSDAVLVRQVEVLSGYPSEHQPVVADLGIASAAKE